jgi:hypothetical protein
MAAGTDFEIKGAVHFVFFRAVDACQVFSTTLGAAIVAVTVAASCFVLFCVCMCVCVCVRK